MLHLIMIDVEKQTWMLTLLLWRWTRQQRVDRPTRDTRSRLRNLLVVQTQVEEMSKDPSFSSFSPSLILNLHPTNDLSSSSSSFSSSSSCLSVHQSLNWIYPPLELSSSLTVVGLHLNYHPSLLCGFSVSV